MKVRLTFFYLCVHSCVLDLSTARGGCVDAVGNGDMDVGGQGVEVVDVGVLAEVKSRWCLYRLL